MSVYHDWGFTESPFQTTALPPNELGDQLLIGRDTEIHRLVRRINNPPKCVTLEGPNGVGKTSLVNVAAYRCYNSFLTTGEGALFIPCEHVFQLSEDPNMENFTDEVYMAVAQTLIRGAKDLQESGRFPQTKAIDRWLNSPQLKTYQVGVFGANVGSAAETNASAGFQRSGFRLEIRNWLGEVFPTLNHGGVVCVLDNIELLQTSANARRFLEQMRDTLLIVPGLRWVLCGALGIVQSAASSPRLEGLLHTPIEVTGVNEVLAPDILRSRQVAFARRLSHAYLPIGPREFEHLYEVLNKNIRNTLNRADNYCMWVAEQNEHPESDAEREAVYLTWLNHESDKAYYAANQYIGNRAWDAFDLAVLKGGSFSPSDFEDFGFNSAQAMNPHIRDLETNGMLSSSQDESDKRRKTIQVTSKGWLVYHARKRLAV